MNKIKNKNILIMLVTLVVVSACGGGGGGSPTPTPTPTPAPVPPAAPIPTVASIVVSNCSSVAGDSTPDLTGIDTTPVFDRSHKQGAPIYHVVTTRQLGNSNPVTLDYMVHEPTGTPKGVMVLIAGGGLNSRIEGTEGLQPDKSSGNFVVRSAHRYQDAGYRVITIDRPSDFASFGPFNVDFDMYRNSMQHAVDLAVILKAENSEGYNVFISGTSRGSISAAAMNTLATGIAMSSPLVGGTSGQPVGSTQLPLSRIQRPTHVMLHTNDTCAVTLPADARTLFDNLNAAGANVSGNEVDGGFQHTTPINVCGAFDFHGFTGIETCAVEKETTWANGVLTNLGANNAPVATSVAVNEGDSISLTATDADTADTLSFAIPFATTSLGGTVATNAAGAVTYTRPTAAITAGAVDTFAFTVSDGNGGVSTAVVSITLP